MYFLRQCLQNDTKCFISFLGVPLSSECDPYIKQNIQTNVNVLNIQETLKETYQNFDNQRQQRSGTLCYFHK